MCVLFSVLSAETRCEEVSVSLEVSAYAAEASMYMYWVAWHPCVARSESGSLKMFFNLSFVREEDEQDELT
jgi:hypothetical protein